jgi:hypothetical protein
MWRYSFVLMAGVATAIVAPLAVAHSGLVRDSAGEAKDAAAMSPDLPTECTNPALCQIHGSSVPIGSGKR